MWSPGRPRRTRLRRTNALSSPSLAGPTRLPPAEAAAAEPAAATVLAAPSPTSDVVGLGRLRAIGFVAPALALIGVFLVCPALWTLYIGATTYRLTGVAARTPDLVGLDNYRRALSDPTFYRSLRLTLVFVLGSAVVGQNVLGFALAYALRSAPAQLRGRVPVDRSARPRRGHRQRPHRTDARRRLAGAVPDDRHRGVQHLAGYRVLDDALRGRVIVGAAITPGDGPAGRLVHRTDAA